MWHGTEYDAAVKNYSTGRICCSVTYIYNRSYVTANIIHNRLSTCKQLYQDHNCSSAYYSLWSIIANKPYYSYLHKQHGLIIECDHAPCESAKNSCVIMTLFEDGSNSVITRSQIACQARVLTATIRKESNFIQLYH